MILFGSYTSPYVRHCRIALNTAGLEYTFTEADYAASDRGSPTKKVPFLEDGDLKLTDSSSILLYIKQKNGEAGFVDVNDFELYALVNTTMDSEINIFLLTKEEGVAASGYIKRQRARVQSGLAHLNFLMESADIKEHQYTDGQLRLACLLDWGLFRQRFSLDEYPALQQFLSTIQTWDAFKSTEPVIR